MSRRFGVLVLGCALALAGAHPSSAARLGAVRAPTLVVLDAPVTIAPPVILGCDNFTGTNNATLAGRTGTTAAVCAAATWSAVLGTWKLASNR